jgi:probable phosphoglycerate mutase
MAVRVIIVRHGQSTYNIENRIQGRMDVSVLTEKGRNEAVLVGQALAGINFSAIYASPLKRAKETAEIISGELRAKQPDSPLPQTIDNLQEIDLRLWEGLLATEVKEKYPEEEKAWRERPWELKMVVPNPDSTQENTTEFYPLLELYNQARQFWQDILSLHQGETILVVAHNCINRCLISTALGVPQTHFHAIKQSNCCINVLNFSLGLGEAVQLESMNQTSHLGQILPGLKGNHQGLRLLLVRHGETEWNRQGKFQGQIDVPLNDNGRLQAQKAGEFLKDVEIDFAVSSTMQRPLETAQIILNHHKSVNLELDAGLREISHGLWEGKFEKEIEQEFPGELESWRTQPEKVQMPEGENLLQVSDRAITAWQSIIQAPNHQGKTGLVVAHDATNKTLLCHILGLSTENFWNFRQGNGAVSVIDYPSGPNSLPILQAMNITSHLTGGVLDKTAAGAL